MPLLIIMTYAPPTLRLPTEPLLHISLYIQDDIQPFFLKTDPDDGHFLLARRSVNTLYNFALICQHFTSVVQGLLLHSPMITDCPGTRKGNGEKAPKSARLTAFPKHFVGCPVFRRKVRRMNIEVPTSRSTSTASSSTSYLTRIRLCHNHRRWNEPDGDFPAALRRLKDIQINEDICVALRETAEDVWSCDKLKDIGLYTSANRLRKASKKQQICSLLAAPEMTRLREPAEVMGIQLTVECAYWEVLVK